jgi:hypothetical protein
VVHGRGPGKILSPRNVPIIHRIIDNRNLAPGTYALRDLVPNKDEKDPSLTANLSHYTTDVRSADYPLRALVFGSESARITGQVAINPDRSKSALDADRSRREAFGLGRHQGHSGAA